MGKLLERRTDRPAGDIGRPVDPPGRGRHLRRPQLGQGVLRHQRPRARHRPPGQGPGPVHRPQGPRRPAPAPRHPAPHPAPVHRHPPAPHRRDRRRLPASPSPSSATRASTRCVYPIKVNQQRHVVEEVLNFGRPHGFGLEAGQQAGTAGRAGRHQRRRRHARSSATGSRTTSSSRWWSWPGRSGKNIIPVVEKFSELELIVKYAEELGVRQPIGVRVKLATRGAGRWRSSAGYRSASSG